MAIAIDSREPVSSSITSTRGESATSGDLGTRHRPDPAGASGVAAAAASAARAPPLAEAARRAAPSTIRGLRIVLGFDKFRGTLAAADACRAAAAALAAGRSDLELVALPQADGGEGTTDALAAALGGRRVEVAATPPLGGARVAASYLWVGQRRLAVVEVAAASGLAAVPPAQRDPLRATTRGTGELIAEALLQAPHGCREVWIAA